MAMAPPSPAQPSHLHPPPGVLPGLHRGSPARFRLIDGWAADLKVLRRREESKAALRRIGDLGGLSAGEEVKEETERM